MITNYTGNFEHMNVFFVTFPIFLSVQSFLFKVFENKCVLLHYCMINSLFMMFLITIIYGSLSETKEQLFEDILVISKMHLHLM